MIDNLIYLITNNYTDIQKLTYKMHEEKNEYLSNKKIMDLLSFAPWLVDEIVNKNIKI